MHCSQFKFDDKRQNKNWGWSLTKYSWVFTVDTEKILSHGATCSFAKLCYVLSYVQAFWYFFSGCAIGDATGALASHNPLDGGCDPSSQCQHRISQRGMGNTEMFVLPQQENDSLVQRARSGGFLSISWVRGRRRAEKTSSVSVSCWVFTCY